MLESAVFLAVQALSRLLLHVCEGMIVKRGQVEAIFPFSILGH